MTVQTWWVSSMDIEKAPVGVPDEIAVLKREDVVAWWEDPCLSH